MATARASSSFDMLRGVLCESRRVAAAHSRHFLALAVLFLLPLSTLLVAFPSVFLSSFPSLRPHRSVPPQSLLRFSFPTFSSSSPFPSSAAAIAAVYTSAILFLYLSAAAAVTHSVHCGFFGRPVKLLPALRSLPSPLFRLLFTLLSAAVPLVALLTLIVSLILISVRSLDLLQLSSYSSLAYSVAGAAAVFGVFCLLINWSLAGVICVVESSWGFEPLRRSTHLIRGMRWAAVSLYLPFASALVLFLWGFSLEGVGVVAGNWWEVVPVIAGTIFGSAVISLLLLHCLVTNAVLYMYCKAVHGELAREIAEEFAWEYICLPFDDQKVPHVVSVVLQ